MSWIPSLFAAEAIPSAMISFVALLMFLQLGEGWGTATLLCSLLTLPWVLKFLLHSKVERMRHLAFVLRATEFLIFVALVVLAFSFGWRIDRVWNVFVSLFVLSVLCAWHELVARIHYENMLRPATQRLYNGMKMFTSQMVAVFTYGAMIVGVGFLEVFYHNRNDALSLSWSMAVYALAGLYLLILIYNIFALPGMSQSQYSHIQPRPLPSKESRNLSPDPSSVGRGRVLRFETLFANTMPPSLLGRAGVGLFFLLLPQALMFHARVLFFIAPRAVGGLGASLQDIGLAQGTVGVIAFSVGLVQGYWLTNDRQKPAVRRRALMAATMLLPLSPLVYWHLSFMLPESLPAMCAATLVAQLLFGFGLNACRPYVKLFSAERYRSATSFLYVPLVALAMLPAMAASGFLAERLGFQAFFAVDSMTILPALAAGALSLTTETKDINSKL